MQFLALILVFLFTISCAKHPAQATQEPVANAEAEEEHLIAGFIGVVENRATGQVQSEIGWAVCEKVESNDKGANSERRNWSGS